MKSEKTINTAEYNVCVSTINTLQSNNYQQYEIWVEGSNPKILGVIFMCDIMWYKSKGTR